MFGELTAAEVIAGWQPGLYEPETTAFGGPAGMDTAHELLCPDSRGVLGYARLDHPPLGRRELFILLVSAMLAAAGLDWPERGDVFDQVAKMKTAPGPADDARTAQLARRLLPLLAQAAPVRLSAFAPGGAATYAAPWIRAFEEAGSRFGDAAN